MKPGRSGPIGERVELAADGAIITAAVLAALTAILLLASVPYENTEVPIAVQLASALVTLLGGICGPAIAWLLHGRRVTVLSVLGAMVGVPLTAVAIVAVALLTFVLGWAVSPISRSEFAGPLVAAGILGAAFAALVVWIVIRAVRGLLSGGEHRSLDFVRVLSGVVVAAYSATVAVLAFRVSGEYGEAVAFMLMAAVAGAAIVTGADLATRFGEHRPQEPASAREQG